MLDHTTEHAWAKDDTLGGRISLARDLAGFSSEDAARRLGVLTSSWEEWESDRNVPRANRLTMMAGILGVSPSWLLDGVGAGPSEWETEADDEARTALLRDFREASDQVALLNRRMDEIAASLERLQPGH